MARELERRCSTGSTFATGDSQGQAPATAVAYGLPHDEALKALTINPAQIWGAGDLIGSLEKGKLADLMIVDGDPMDVRTQIRHLFIKGKEITLSNKQIRLYERYMSRQ